MKLYVLVFLLFFITACAPVSSSSTYPIEPPQPTWLRPNTTQKETLRDQESCRQSEVAAGGSPYELYGLAFRGAIAMCMQRLGYKQK